MKVIDLDTLSIILSAIIIPICVITIYSVIQKSNSKTSKTMSDEHFVVSIPRMILAIGIVGILVFVGIILGFTCFSKELPHIVFYIVFGLLLWLKHIWF